MPVQPATSGDNRVVPTCVGEDFLPKHLRLNWGLNRKFRAVFEQLRKPSRDVVVGVSRLIIR